MARVEHVDIQLPTWTERNLQPASEPRERMVLKTVSAVDEVPAYRQLQRQVREALRAQHPEWVQPNGDSPICDAYESRFAELLRTLTRETRDKKCGKIRTYRRVPMVLVTESLCKPVCHQSISHVHQT